MRDHPDISAGLKTKVRKVAEELGYVPNFTARNLQAQKTFTIGVVVPDITNSFFSYAIHGIMDAAHELGYHLVLTASRENVGIEKENIMTLLSMRVDGILIAVSRETTDAAIFETVRKMKVPLVFFDRAIESLNFSSVGIDDRQAATTLLNYVIDQGYTRIAHVAGSFTADIARKRRQGYIDALKKHNIPIRDDWIVEGDFTRSGGCQGFQKICATGNVPEVVFAVNDSAATGVYKAIWEAGLSVPNDIGVVAFSHTKFAELLNPSLTIVDSVPQILGQRAMQLLFSEIKDSPSYTQKIVLGTRLIPNDSLKLKHNSNQHLQA